MANECGKDRAFAVSWFHSGVSNYQQGMTLRDYFTTGCAYRLVGNPHN